MIKGCVTLFLYIYYKNVLEQNELQTMCLVIGAFIIACNKAAISYKGAFIIDRGPQDWSKLVLGWGLKFASDI